MSMKQLVLKRLPAIGFAAVVAIGLVSIPATANAGAVGYTMGCGDHWSGTTTVNRGETARNIVPDSSCASHYAWLNVYSNWGTSGKKRSPMQAIPGAVAVVTHRFEGQTIRSWHSGCADGCHSRYSYV